MNPPPPETLALCFVRFLNFFKFFFFYNFVYFCIISGVFLSCSLFDPLVPLYTCSQNKGVLPIPVLWTKQMINKQHSYLLCLSAGIHDSVVENWQQQAIPCGHVDFKCVKS